MKKKELIKLLQNEKNEIFLSKYKSVVVEDKDTCRVAAEWEEVYG